MALFAGRILLADGAPEGWISVGAGRIEATGTGPSPEKPVATGWIVPAPVNAHTHVADAFLREVPGKPATVAALVGPGGWKHQQLAAAKPTDIRAGIARYVGEMAAIGTARFLDFREGGLEGARLLRSMAAELPVRPVVFGRPKTPTFDLYEAEDLVPHVDGIGLSALRDFTRPRHASEWTEFCHEHGKPLALHASESSREDVEAVLALEPAFLVHATQATPRDLQAIGGAGVPVVVCPRSNARYGMKSPVPGMLEAGIQVAVGTDNGMLHDGDLRAELAQLQAWHPGLGTEELLRMATWNARRIAGIATRPPRAGGDADWVVLPDRPWAPGASGKPTLAVRA